MLKFALKNKSWRPKRPPDLGAEYEFPVPKGSAT